MKKVHPIFLCVIFLACFAIPTTFFMWKHGPQITLERFERLREGMTEEEVTEILGGPPADYTDDQGYYPCALVSVSAKDLAGRGEISADMARPGEHWVSIWCGHQGMIRASFDVSGKFSYKSFDSSDAPSTVWERIRAFLRRG